jgi:SEC-C motif-containing protein
MRSRYAAFATGNTAYLLTTWHPSTRPKRLVLDPDQQWLGLRVVRSAGGFLDTEGTVEFRATWSMGGRTDVLHETSRFVREDGHWLYLNGQVR